MDLYTETGLAFCEACDTYTPQAECARCGETECAYCLEAYGYCCE